MADPHRLTPIAIIKLVILGGIFSTLLVIAIYGGADKTPEVEKESGATQALVNSITAGAEKVNSTTKVMTDAGVYTMESKDPGQLDGIPENQHETVMCPQYILPTLPELPELPPREVMDSVSQEQLNFILYQHIKAHQDRTIVVRKRIFQSYAKYLESCE